MSARQVQPLRAFAPGARVLIRDEEWMVRGAEIAGHGGQTVRVVGFSELVRSKEALFLTALDDIVELAPEKTVLVADDSPRYRKSRLYLESLFRHSPPTEPHLYIGHQAAIDRTPYQWVPASKALKQMRPRILMADGVGLGKTIEVGILLSELIRRGRGDRILVVALKSILAQFQEELWARFTIPLVRLDSVGIRRVQSKIPSNMNPFYHFDRAIISVDTLNMDGKYRRYLEDAHWDVIVIDECQNVAERGTGRSTSQRARLARLLSRTCDALILTSATPHDGSPASFASLMRLLDPTAIADPKNFTKDDVEDLFVRRFAKDVRGVSADNFRERDVELVSIDPHEAEEAALKAIGRAEFHTIGRSRSIGGSGHGVLFRTTLLKAFLSSPVACKSTCQNRLKHKRLRPPDDGQVDDGQLDDDARHDIAVLKDLIRHCDAVTADRFQKLHGLFELLESYGYKKGRAGDRVVVFSERIDTLNFLEAQLAQRFGLTLTEGRKDTNKWKKGQIAKFHGGVPDRDQYELINDFGNRKGKIRILLGSDAAAEGINLHYECHRMVHFDVPWSLITHADCGEIASSRELDCARASAARFSESAQSYQRYVEHDSEVLGVLDGMQANSQQRQFRRSLPSSATGASTATARPTRPRFAICSSTPRRTSSKATSASSSASSTKRPRPTRTSVMSRG